MRLESSCFFLDIALTIRSTHESVGNCRGSQCVVYNSAYGAASGVHLPCVTARSDPKGSFITQAVDVEPDAVRLEPAQLKSRLKPFLMLDQIEFFSSIVVGLGFLSGNPPSAIACGRITPTVISPSVK